MCKFSIIVPVYNSEMYLEKCLSSLANQTYQNIEVIIINDGSTDGSKEICEKFCKQYSNFMLINQQNCGVSIARNNGIDKSNGERIIFIDSDDYLEKEAMEIINNNLNDEDLLCYSYTRLYKNKRRCNTVKNNTYSNKKFIEKVILDDSIGGYLWNKVFKTSIIKKNKLEFDRELFCCEDLVFVLEYLKRCNLIRTIDKALYNYRIRKSSVSHDLKSSKTATIVNSYEKIINEYSLNEECRTKMINDYIVSYYRFKKIIQSNKMKIRQDFLLREKEIISRKETSKKIKFLIIKYIPTVYFMLSKIKQKKNKLFC